ncbi:MAG: hypothetical protein ACI97N_000124 [Cognaticolwellia sp.]|jgi:hypothetical protein
MSTYIAAHGKTIHRTLGIRIKVIDTALILVFKTKLQRCLFNGNQL